MGPAQPTPYSPYAPLPAALSRLVEELAKLEYPITSKKDFVDKVGGADGRLFMGELVVEAGIAAMFLPAALFPVATVENLAEKLSETYARRAPFPRRRRRGDDELHGLAARFLAENPELVTAAASAARWLTTVADEGAEGVDVAARFLEANPKLLRAAAAALENRGELLRSDQ